MKIARVRFGASSTASVAVAVGAHWVRVGAIDPEVQFVKEVLGDVGRLADAVERIDDVVRLEASGDAIGIDSAILDVPLDCTGKLLAIGRNYLAHIEETRATRPDHPLLFGKFPSSLTGPYADVAIDPELTREADYEVELAVVIGPGGRSIVAADAYRAVVGYAVANDLSSRDNQRDESQWIRSKSFDGFCPLGPWITTSDEVADPANLRLTTDVNGERRQDSNTSLMLFGIPELIEYLSQGISLLPGDVVLTGTPSGVGLGMEPPRFLQPGDVVRCEIESLGHLENTMVAS